MITVYYAVDTFGNFELGNETFQETLNEIMIESLVSVYLDLKEHENKDKPDNIFACKSFLQYTKNMYLMKNPFDLDIRVEKNQVLNFGNKKLDNMLKTRLLQVENAYNFNYTPSYIFFSEQSLEMETLSPFMHKNTFCKNGYIYPGVFNISGWFRPVNAALQFYDNTDKTIFSLKGDPIMYIKFLTDEPVRLKRFTINQELKDIMATTTIYKRYDPNRSLNYLYDKFTKSGLQKKTLKLIKENLI
jgi:hypothetical protein